MSKSYEDFVEEMKRDNIKAIIWAGIIIFLFGMLVGVMIVNLRWAE